MSGKILIVDPVSTNRIVLRVKMMAAQYTVDTCESCAEALDTIDETAPDLILINLSNKTDEGYEFCRKLREEAKTRDIAIVSTGVADTSRARFRALDAGADDVLPRPMIDALLLSRVRNLLRRRNVNQDLMMRDGTSRALGFEEEIAPRLTPANVSVVCHNARLGVSIVQDLQAGLRQRIHMITGFRQFDTLTSNGVPDLFVVHGADGLMDQSKLLQLVCDLKTRSETYHAAQLVIVPAGEETLAATVMDMGATDVMFDDADPEELQLRARKLIQTKTRDDQLRDRVRMGLRAAVTDPLTGLFNRRYAEAHLRRVADKARMTGQPYAIIMLDLDHFKSINDTHGHAAGDGVLTQLAERMRATFRDLDLLARIGGEEFLVALPNTTVSEAEQAGERLRKMVRETNFRLPEPESTLKVTASVGIAVHTPADEGKETPTALSDMFQLADAALYSAKSAGRDVVSLCCAAA